MLPWEDETSMFSKEPYASLSLGMNVFIGRWQHDDVNNNMMYVIIGDDEPIFLPSTFTMDECKNHATMVLIDKVKKFFSLLGNVKKFFNL